jgi:hypothetical protein
VPKHITIGLFETFETLGQTLVRNVQDLIKLYGTQKNILGYVKDEGSYLNTRTTIYETIVNCETLSMVENVKGTCFVHTFLKACQYVTPEEKVCRGFKYISIKFCQIFYIKMYKVA